RRELDHLSVSLQAAGPHAGAGDLRALSTAVRVEPLVRLARAVARIPLGAPDGGAPPRRRSTGPAALLQQPVPRPPADLGAGGQMAVLVHDARGEARHGRVLETRGARPLRPGAPQAERPDRGGPTAPVTGQAASARAPWNFGRSRTMSSRTASPPSKCQ